MTMADHPYVGMWVTADGYIRHELLPEGRYDEARGKRKSAYRGRYTVTGTHIDYVDETGPPMEISSTVFCTMPAWCCAARSEQTLGGAFGCPSSLQQIVRRSLQSGDVAHRGRAEQARIFP